MSKLAGMKRRIESIEAFRDMPKYAVEVVEGKLVVCKNDGNFHTGEESGGGWATYIGAFTELEAEQEFRYELESAECDLDEFGNPIAD